MLDLKIIDKIKADFTWKDNKKSKLTAGKESQVAEVESGQVIQIHQHFDIGDIQALSIGGSDIPELLRNASGRLALEQAVKQENFQKAVQQAELENIESHKPLDKDWFIRWMDVAQSIGQDDIRNILSSILRGEVSTETATSVGTLEILRNLSITDLELFQKFCNISFSCSSIPGLTLVVTDPYGSPDQNSMEVIGLNYPKLTELQDLGLIKNDLNANHPGVAQLIHRKIPFTIGPDTFQQTEDVEFKDNFKPRVIFFTRAGLEIRECLTLVSNDAYVTKFKEWLVNSFPEVKKENVDTSARDTTEPESEND